MPDEPIDEAATRELRENQAATLRALARWPGIEARYRRPKIDAWVIAQRPRLDKLPPAEAEREKLDPPALHAPGSVAALPRLPPSAPPSRAAVAERSSTPALRAAAAALALAACSARPAPAVPASDSSRQAHRVERQEKCPEKNGMIIPFRAESLLSVAEFIKVQRSTDDEPDDNAADAAANLDHLSITRDGERVVLQGALRPRPALGRRGRRRARRRHPAARMGLPQEPAARGPRPPRRTHALDPRPARRPQRPARAPALHCTLAAPPVRRATQRRWLKAQPTAIRASTRRGGAQPPTAPPATIRPTGSTFSPRARCERDLACLALADLSLSTDAWVASEARVIDVIRDSLLLFGEGLLATGDSFALCGFPRSSAERALPPLEGPRPALRRPARGRIMAIAGLLFRLGAAIRHATTIPTASAPHAASC